MGLTVGTEVAVMGFAPLGDPMKLSLQGYRLGLRKEEAQLIVVEQAENGR
jgi:ferrous iron transport protein A